MNEPKAKKRNTHWRVEQKKTHTANNTRAQFIRAFTFTVMISTESEKHREKKKRSMPKL